MDRTLLVLATLAAVASTLVRPDTKLVQVVAPAFVGLVGFLISLRAELRAVRAEQRAAAAEQRARESDIRDREVHAWARDAHLAREEEERARRQILDWVAERKASRGTSFCELELADLEIARAAERLGLVTLRELEGAEGVEAAMYRVC